MRFVKLKKAVRRKKYWLAGILLLGALGWLAHIVSAPVKGHYVPVDARLLKHSRSAPTVQLPPAAVQATYFTLDLPAGYRVQESSNSVPGLLYEQTLIKPSLAGSLIISITIKNMPAGGLDSESSYQWRSAHSDHFQIGNQNAGGDTITVANDTQSASILAYWPHGAYLATISITSGVDNPAVNDNKDETAALQPLLKGWQWQR